MSTSSSDLDGEEAERLRSVAVDSASIAGVAAALSQKNNKKKDNPQRIDDEAASSLKFYQARGRDLLHKYLDRTFDIKRVKYEESEFPDPHYIGEAEDTGFHLFKRAPSGLSDKQDRQVSTPKRKPQDHNPDESSEMVKASLLAAAIDGTTVTLHAEKLKAKAFASWVLHQEREKEARRKEEERIAALKVQRGEQWLPSVAKDMQTDSVHGGSSLVKMAIEQNKCKDIQRKDANQKSKKKISKLEVAAVK